MRARFQGLPRPSSSTTLLPAWGSVSDSQAPLSRAWRLVRNPAGPSLGGAQGWGEASWAHKLLEVAWPQSPLEPKGWGVGVGENPSPSRPLPCAQVGCCLGAAALVRRPRQAKAEKPERTWAPPGSPEVLGPCQTRGGDGVQHRMHSSGLGWLEWPAWVQPGSQLGALPSGTGLFSVSLAFERRGQGPCSWSPGPRTNV